MKLLCACGHHRRNHGRHGCRKAHRFGGCNCGSFQPRKPAQ